MTNCIEAVGGELAEGRQMRHIREKAPDFMAAQCLSRFMRLFLSTIYVVQSQPLWIIWFSLRHLQRLFQHRNIWHFLSKRIYQYVGNRIFVIKWKQIVIFAWNGAFTDTLSCMKAKNEHKFQCFLLFTYKHELDLSIYECV